MAKNMLPRKIEKIRIGGNGDGGYVVPIRSVEECDLFVLDWVVTYSMRSNQ